MKKIKSVIAIIMCIITVVGCAPKETAPEEYKPMLITEIEMPTETTVHALLPFSEETTTVPEKPVSSETTPLPIEPVSSETTENSVMPISSSQPMQVADMGFSHSVNVLGVSVYDDIKGDGNVFYSPYSINIALSMLINGADEKTEAELKRVLAIDDIDKRNEEISAIMKSFNDKKAVVETANSVWIDKDFEKIAPTRKEFISPLKEFYNAEVEHADFGDSATVKKVNSWISKKTNKMIPSMLSNIPADTVMLLINAVYFDGKWQTPFLEDDTTDWTFEGTQGDTTVDMMRIFDGNFRYYSKGKLKGVSIPYGDGKIVMDVFVANDNSKKNAVEIFDDMSEEERLELLSSMENASYSEIFLAIPKFTFETETFSVKDAIKSMGAEDVFDAGKADLRSMSELPDDYNLFVSDILHKAKIEVDENGTKAAAATIIMVDNCCEAITLEDPKEFIADEPFVFTIRDTESGTILFMGTISNLSK